MVLLHYKVWEAWGHKVRGETITQDNITDPVLRHQECYFEIDNKSGMVIERTPKNKDDCYHIKANKDNKNYLIPKRFIDKMPLKPTKTQEVRLKRSDSVVWYLVLDIDTFTIPRQPFVDVESFIMNEFNPVQHTNPDDLMLLKLIAIAPELKVAVCGNVGCVDCDTEFFNGYQWKKISEYNKKDQVLQYNIDGTAELVNPINYIKKRNDFFYNFEHKYGLNQQVSSEHRCLYLTSKNNLNVKTAEELVNMHNKSKQGFSGRFLCSFKMKRESRMNISNVELKLMCAVIADSTFTNSNKKHPERVCFRLKKERKKERLINLLKEAKIDFIKSDYKDGYSHIKFDAPIITKIFDKRFYDCSYEQLKIISDEVLFWDGNCIDEFYSTIKESADFIQYCFAATDNRTTYALDNRIGRKKGKYMFKSICYRVGKCKKKYYKISAHEEDKKIIDKIKSKDGFEYCFTVPSEFLVLRKNNRIFITGNCMKNSNLTILRHMLGNYAPKVIKPTQAKLWVTMKNNEYINLDEITSWAPEFVKNIEDLAAASADESPDMDKYSLGRNKDMEIMGLGKKSLTFTFNRPDELDKKKGVPFEHKFENPTKIIDRFPRLLFSGKVLSSIDKPKPHETNELVNKHFKTMCQIAAKIEYLRNNYELHMHNWSRDKSIFKKNIRYEANIKPLIDLIDVISKSQDIFDDRLMYLNKKYTDYLDMIHGTTTVQEGIKQKEEPKQEVWDFSKVR